jgi:hypothetical protein
MHVFKPRRPNPDEFQGSLEPTTTAAKTLLHDFLQLSKMKTSPPSDSTPTSITNQDPSSPPAALTVVLSVACGAVATCILLTVRTPIRPPPKKKKEKEKKKGFSYMCTCSGGNSQPYYSRSSFYSCAIAPTSRLSAKANVLHPGRQQQQDQQETKLPHTSPAKRTPTLLQMAPPPSLSIRQTPLWRTFPSCTAALPLLRL